MALPPPHLKARKRFGQNFLVDDFIIGAIVNAINPKEGDYLVEIGPGHAALTRPVLERAKALTAIELDRDLAAILRSDPFLKGLTLIEADALKVNFEALPGSGDLRVFGNLPYNITSPIIFHLLSQRGIKDMHFMLQKEVVDRMVAAHGSKTYGRLSVMLQWRYRMTKLFDVPPGAFNPPPKVMSSVVRMVPKAKNEVPAVDFELFASIVANAFSQRRKTIRNALSSLLSAEEITACDVDPGARAEALPLDSFVRLTQKAQELGRKPVTPGTVSD